MWWNRSYQLELQSIPDHGGKPSYQGKGNKGASPGKGPSNYSQKSEGKGGSKGKNGKMFAVCDDSGTWWYSEATEGESFEEITEEPAEPAAPAEESVLVLSSVLSPFLPGLAKESKEFMSPNQPNCTLSRSILGN